MPTSVPTSSTPIFPPPAAPPAPIARAERIRGIDIARGLALLGILLVNVRFFFAPFASGLRPVQVDSMPVPDAFDIAAWAFVETFATFKCISLFSMLFGFGLALQAARLEAAGRSRWGFGLRRLAVLLVVGLLHGFVVWYGDILALYSVLGVGVLVALALPSRWLLRVAGLMAALLLLLSIGAATVQYVTASHPQWFQRPAAATAEAPDAGEATDPGEPIKRGEPIEPREPADSLAADPPRPTDSSGPGESAGATEAGTAPRGVDAMLAAGFDFNSPEWMEGEIAAYRDGPFVHALAFRAISYAIALLAAPFGYGWHAFAMMLFGAWAYRTGLFAGEETSPGASRRRRWLAAACIVLGTPLAIGGVLPWLLLGLESPLALALHTVFLELGGLVLPIGYACAIVEYGPRLPRVLAVALERAGRMAMTIYLCESLVCVTLASWWGFGWFGSMQDGRLTIVAVAVWASLVMGAALWLGRYRIGPAEWLWRRLSYGRNPVEP